MDKRTKAAEGQGSGFTGLKSPSGRRIFWVQSIARSQPKVPPFTTICARTATCRRWIPGILAIEKLAASQRVRSAFPHVEVILISRQTRTDSGAPGSVRDLSMIRMTST